jgi:hypothetical protein
MLTRLGQVLCWIACALPLTSMGIGSASAQASSPSDAILGIGSLSCANWLSSPASEHDGQMWILGYWSAVNDLNGFHLGHDVDATAIWAQTKKICMDKPSTIMAAAVAGAYFQFQHSGKVN